MFTAALFTIARTWKQPRCPLTNEWIKKFWYIYITEYYSAIKRNTFESVAMRWIKLEPVIESEVSQKRMINIIHMAHNISYIHIISYIWHIHMKSRKMVLKNFICMVAME